MQSYETFFLEPLREVYLKSTHTNFTPSQVFTTGNINNVYIFSVIGIFILLIACINFINLTTARSAERPKRSGGSQSSWRCKISAYKTIYQRISHHFFDCFL